MLTLKDAAQRLPMAQAANARRNPLFASESPCFTARCKTRVGGRSSLLPVYPAVGKQQRWASPNTWADKLMTGMKQVGSLLALTVMPNSNGLQARLQIRFALKPR